MTGRVSISVETVNKIMTVLGQLPYSQIAELVAEIQPDVKPIEEVLDDG